MSISFRTYRYEPRFGDDYQNILAFLRDVNHPSLTHPNFTWGRWAWLISRPEDDESIRQKFGIWEEDGQMVAVALFESVINDVYVVIKEEHRHLTEAIITYAKNQLMKENRLRIIADTDDMHVLDTLSKHGFIRTEHHEAVSEFLIQGPLEIDLDSAYTLIDMQDDWDDLAYNEVMWKGFDHPGEPDHSEKTLAYRKTMLSSPDVDPTLVLAIKDKQGHYLSHAAAWYKEGDSYAYLEPVATWPEYRKQGLAKACVFQLVNLLWEKGVKKLVVGSSQPFYRNIGFRPYRSYAWWEYLHE